MSPIIHHYPKHCPPIHWNPLAHGGTHPAKYGKYGKNGGVVGGIHPCLPASEQTSPLAATHLVPQAVPDAQLESEKV